MIIILTILGTVIGIVILLFAWLWFSSWMDEREERKAYKKRKDSFDYVARNIKGCTYWLNGDHRKPFREFFDFIVKEMEDRNAVHSESLRIEADRISSTLTSNR